MSNPAIVILTYKRKAYLLRTLDSLMAAPGVDAYTLYVSQDGSEPDLSDLAERYKAQHELTLLNHPRLPLMVADQGATAYLAQHYKWVLDLLFLTKNHSHVVIMEDDMIVSPDFLTLFSETAHLLDTDPTLFCVSSWNDNGMKRLVADPTRLMRTDYFPGLGWMTNAVIWSELSPIFPLDQWDHFMRLDTTHRGRDCLIPEVARNHNIGEEGTNMGQGFYGRFLAPIAFNTVATSFLRQDGERRTLEHMRSERFEADMQERITKATIIGMFGSPEVQKELSRLAAMQATAPEEEAKIILYDRSQYPSIASQLGLLPVPRSIHKGVISIRLG
jgi:alpha-1,3-mannosyl-glycoprotein beta-1,2-N-acetylglucosaminyltransferase